MFFILKIQNFIVSTIFQFDLHWAERPRFSDVRRAFPCWPISRLLLHQPGRRLWLREEGHLEGGSWRTPCQRRRGRLWPSGSGEGRSLHFLHQKWWVKYNLAHHSWHLLRTIQINSFFVLPALLLLLSESFLQAITNIVARKITIPEKNAFFCIRVKVYF